MFPLVGFAYSSDICTGATCTENKVGPFMKGISTACGNVGNCSLEDIMLVFANTGNFIIGIIGGIVLLMYVIGGFYMLTSAGSSDRVMKGRKFLTISTTGLIIVMVAFVAIKTLEATFKTSTGAGTDKYVTCDESTIGQPCAPFKECAKLSTGKITCLTSCYARYIDTTCEDVDTAKILLKKEFYSGCLPNLCTNLEYCCKYNETVEKLLVL
jgi:hypothetical protein